LPEKRHQVLLTSKIFVTEAMSVL